MLQPPGVALVNFRHHLVWISIALGFMNSGSASAQDYIFDAVKSNPSLLKAWHKIVPKYLKSNDWIYNFGGVSNPVDIVTVHGKRFYLGWVCQPHDCSGNSATFLIAVDGSEAQGAVSSVNLGYKMKWLGAPDQEQRQLLQSKIDG
jgi:hypothetical protein